MRRAGIAAALMAAGLAVAGPASAQDPAAAPTLGDRILFDYQRRLSEATRDAVVARAQRDEAEARLNAEIAALRERCGAACKSTPEPAGKE